MCIRDSFNPCACNYVEVEEPEGEPELTMTEEIFGSEEEFIRYREK